MSAEAAEASAAEASATDAGAADAGAEERALPRARSQVRPARAWRVWLALAGVCLGTCVSCVAVTIGYALFLDYKSQHR